uniref:Centromere protein U n=1 Tax=Gallus gallus TaxID=9031 RepID=CENPU_CHICK|nr:RecName: Full=Centromere protein U; Short=CENP-U; AltName: Full=Centromere protein p50; AltName: Full=MLF1-interacting protein; AltName: Full=centromere protein of 50 kDa; Short=CENP-50 [Gallus gallus]BAE48587.1 centromere protein p50 [Gallus gallus]|eukprot:NP_001034388.1 centromere protein U [Gallus gallus]
MSSKKRTKRNRAGDEYKEHKGRSHPRRKFLPPEEPDVSRISKVAGVNQLEELCDSFDQPLHSTAVDACGEEHSENESSGYVPAPQRTNAERSEKMLLETPEGDVHEFSQSGSVREPLMENLNAPNTTRSEVKKKRPSKKSSSDSSVNSPSSVQLWCPNKLKRSSRDITELDVVLAEFEKIAANYRQSIESKACRKAVSAFCSAFEDQVTDLITEVQELKNTKKKNAKVVADIKKKRQRLMQVREKLSRTEPQLIKLQKEYAEVEERRSSLRQVVQFLTDLKELQQDYLDYREENPRKKVVYGASSLPALLVESRRILQAERHFQNINRKLEYALEVQRGKLAKEH